MKASDIDKARALISERDEMRRLKDKLDGLEALKLTVGSGGDVREIVLASAYAASLRSDIRLAVRERIDAATKALAEMGVEG